MRTLYFASDGTEFYSKLECRRHEKESFYQALVGLTAEQIQAGINRTNHEVAMALERAGTMVAAARRADGELRRRIKPPTREGSLIKLTD